MTRPRDIADGINRIDTSAADATAITIDSSENVGVGITSSLEKFTVANTSSGIVGRFTNNVNQTLDLGITSGSGSAGGAYLNNANSGYVAFQSGGSERLRMLAGGGLTFNGDTAAANALDDYEEGTWTPIIYDQNTSGHQLTISGVVGRYTKIGRWVNCTLVVTRADATSLTNIITFTNLPFTTGPTSSVTGGTFWLDKTSSDRIGVIYVPPNGNSFYLVPTHATDNYLLMSEWQNGRPIYLQISFEAA